MTAPDPVSLGERPGVRGQRWDELPVPAIDDWTPTMSVSVVIPARDCQLELDRTLASLGGQSYPSDLMEIVVVDDASRVPLTEPTIGPKNTTIIRVGETSEHGSGRARAVGAKAASGDVLLFLDADMVASRGHVAAHARWHHLVADAVVLGRKWFVEFDGITADEVRRAVATGNIDRLLAGRHREPHRWQEALIRERGMLTEEHPDNFLTVVGASVSVRREFYHSAGGFAPYGLRGIVDTEFGYRAYARGALLVPEQEAPAYHQGARSFSTKGAEIKRQRTGLAANLLPIEMFRQPTRGRQWQVPRLVAIVEGGTGATAEELEVTVDSLLASDFDDLVVQVVEDKGTEWPSWLHDYFAHDGRVSFLRSRPRDVYPSPWELRIGAGLAVAPPTVGDLLALLEDKACGSVLVAPPGGDPCARLSATRAAIRAREAESEIADLFGELLVSASDYRIEPATYSLTPQGMVRPSPVGGPS